LERIGPSDGNEEKKDLSVMMEEEEEEESEIELHYEDFMREVEDEAHKEEKISFVGGNPEEAGEEPFNEGDSFMSDSE